MTESCRTTRLIGCAVLSHAVLTAQENAAVGWDPRETGESLLSLSTLAKVFVLGLVCYGLWRFLIWSLERRRTFIPWARLRWYLPTAMLVWGWITVTMLLLVRSEGFVFTSLLVIFCLPNILCLVPVAAVLGLAESAPNWVRLAAGSLVFWGAWHLVVRLAEWRAWSNIPVSLELSGDAEPKP
jgi:hypothetical protein